MYVAVFNHVFSLALPHLCLSLAYVRMFHVLATCPYKIVFMKAETFADILSL